MAEDLLEIQNLSASIGDKSILHEISLHVKRGETHVLMGPNGAGKSTLGYTLMGNPDYTVSGGRILFGGEDITEESLKRRAERSLAVFRAADHYGGAMETDIQNVIREEAARYFKGEITAEKAAEYIQNRVSIYLAEQG